jgi:hypothetical protein
MPDVLALDLIRPFQTVVSLVIHVACVGTAGYAAVHSIAQRSDAFTAAGKLSKPAWVAINTGALFFSLLALYYASAVPDLFTIIAITAVLVYIVDVRPAVREVSEGGSSPW